MHPIASKEQQGQAPRASSATGCNTTTNLARPHGKHSGTTSRPSLFQFGFSFTKSVWNLTWAPKSAELFRTFFKNRSKLLFSASGEATSSACTEQQQQVSGRQTRPHTATALLSEKHLLVPRRKQPLQAGKSSLGFPDPLHIIVTVIYHIFKCEKKVISRPTFAPAYLEKQTIKPELPPATQLRTDPISRPKWGAYPRQHFSQHSAAFPLPPLRALPHPAHLLQGCKAGTLLSPQPLRWSPLLPQCNMHWYKPLQGLWCGYMWIITWRVYQEPRAIKKQHKQHTTGIALISPTSSCSISGSSLLVKELSQQLKPDSMNIIITTIYLNYSSMQKILF